MNGNVVCGMGTGKFYGMELILLCPAA